jgi:hypothetical protein
VASRAIPRDPSHHSIRQSPGRRNAFIAAARFYAQINTALVTW